jgi:hypothetical protein
VDGSSQCDHPGEHVLVSFSRSNPRETITTNGDTGTKPALVCLDYYRGVCVATQLETTSERSNTAHWNTENEVFATLLVLKRCSADEDATEGRDPSTVAANA